ncbi:MAG: adenylosuccinate synthase [Gemmatimonadaceae bacterium]|nr:adenylosuccinate synthase [Acetobacteraceae bacterium]
MIKALAFGALLLAAPSAAFAHGPAPSAAHGGTIAETSTHYWVELVMSGDRIAAYVVDDGGKPIASAQLGGKATVLAGGKRQEVALQPAEGNSLAGKLAGPVQGRATTVLQLTVDGKPTQVRFAAP